MIELVYKVGSENPSVTNKTDILQSSSHKASGFFSPLSDEFDVPPTPEGTPAQAPVAHKGSIHTLKANSSNIDLTIFTANVDVRLDEKMAGELVRATKKNPPSRLRYDLIYVSFMVKHILERVINLAKTGKDEYDSSIRAEEEAGHTGSVFQRLRADLEGFVTSLRIKLLINPPNRTGSTRVFIVGVYCLYFVGKFIVL